MIFPPKCMTREVKSPRSSEKGDFFTIFATKYHYDYEFQENIAAHRAAAHRRPGAQNLDHWLSSAAGEVYVCENAAYHPYSEDEAAKVLAEHDILVKVDMGTGDASAKAWGCDLTYDYVKINGDYRT